jgi:hypothetical protein
MTAECSTGALACLVGSARDTSGEDGAWASTTWTGLDWPTIGARRGTGGGGGDNGA